MQAFLDAARWAAVALSLAWIGLLAAAAMASLTTPQRCRMIATALILGNAIGTQIERLGEPATWLTLRVPVTAVACSVGIWATWMFVARGDGTRRPHRPFRRNGGGR